MADKSKNKEIVFGFLKQLSYVSTILLLIIAFLYIATCSIPLSNTRNSQTVYAFNDGWLRMTPTGTEPVILPSTIRTDEDSLTIYHTIPAAAERNYDTLSFKSLGQCVLVSVNGELLYSLNSEWALARTVRVHAPCIINLPSTEEPYNLEITFTHLNTQICKLPEVGVGTYSGIFRTILINELGVLIGFAIVCVLLIMSVLVAIYFAIRKIFDHRINILVVLLLCVNTWAVTFSPIMALSGINLEKMFAVSYLAFMIIPLLIMRLARASLDRNKALAIMEYIIYVELIVQVLNLLFGVIPVHYFIKVTHGVLLATLVISLIISWKKWSTTYSLPYRYLYYSMLVLIVMVSAAILANRFISGAVYRVLFLIGVIIFACGVFFIILSSVSKILLENEKQLQHISLYKQLAMYDSLTGLGNRRLFEKTLKDIVSDTKFRDSILIMLDLNGLKYTNDTYGHRAGDNLIIASADILEKTFQNYGEIFRIGGDEFAVIITDLTMDFTSLDALLQKELDLYNESAVYPLSIARGASRLITEDGKPLSANDWKQAADLNMYANKRSCRSDYPTEAEELREIINGVVEIVEARDPYTAHHSGRVARLSCLIAGKLGLSDRTVEDIHSAAEMHDIGKIAISESILLKPGRLTDLEYNNMKQHPVIGASIVAHAESMAEIAQIIRHHHERYDGKGYPDRLSGEDIPIGSRIIAIADSIDAMTSKRCYRDALPIDICFEEIKKNLGIMYDPAIGKIVMDNWDEVTALLTD